MKSTRLALVLALAPLGCAASTPAPAQPGAQVAVVDVNAPPPPVAAAEKAPEAAKAAEAEPPTPPSDAPEDLSNTVVHGALTPADDKNGAVLGGLIGTDVGDAFGAGGLGLTGVGIGAGGTGTGTIGLGTIGTFGHGSGTGQGYTYGAGPSKGPGPKVTMGEANISGRLPPDVVKRIVRQYFGQYRFCYEKGLQANPSIQGQVKVRFVIEQDGAVKTATNAGADLADTNVVNCVVNVFKRLSFPKPVSGVVLVTAPLRFAPPEKAAPPPPPPTTPGAKPQPAKSP